MAQLFPRWANNAARATIIIGIVLLVAAPVALLAWSRAPAATGQYALVKQPVPFSHPLHVNAQRIDCLYCHAGAERAAMAGLPPTSACVSCHKEGLFNSRLFAPVRRSLEAGTPVQWQRVNSVPDFVYFNHAVHTRNGVGCETCHGRVDLMDRVYQFAPLTMGWCVQCHNAPQQYVRPVSEVTTMGWEPAKSEGSVDNSLEQVHRVRSLTACTACHR